MIEILHNRSAVAKMMLVRFSVKILLFLCVYFFSLAGKWVLLPVPLLKQQHELSCEASAVRMVLSFWGHSLSEDDLIKLIPVDRTAKTKDQWGDPDAAFVGDVDGQMMVGGYGVYPKGLKKLADTVGFSLKGQSSVWTSKDLDAYLEAGVPVLLWGSMLPMRPVQWRTPAGKMVTGDQNEHVYVVKGFYRDYFHENYILNDPHTGLEITLSSQELNHRWHALGRMAVALLPKGLERNFENLK